MPIPGYDPDDIVEVSLEDGGPGASVAVVAARVPERLALERADANEPDADARAATTRTRPRSATPFASSVSRT